MIPDVSARAIQTQDGTIVAVSVERMDLPSNPADAVAYARRRPHRFRVFAVPSIAVTGIQDRDTGTIRTIADADLANSDPRPPLPEPDPRPQPPVPNDEENPE